MARDSRTPDSVSRRRRRSSSSSSSSSSDSDHRQSSSSRKTKSKRSRSRSRTNSKDGSRSRKKRSSRSSSRDRRRRHYRSRSRSRSRGTSSNSSSISHSRSSGNKKELRTSSDKSRHATSDTGTHFKNMSPEEQLKSKMQMALKAAAEADAQLREKGILPNGRICINSVKDTIPVPTTSNGADNLTIQEQINRVQAIDLINAPGFAPQEFYSDRQVSNHGSTDHSNYDAQLTTKLLGNPVIEKLMQNELAHENLFADKEIRQEKWVRKLYTMRLKKLNGEAMS
ncbi:hypothetical protein CHUAL_002433 [Chamberlinius hualienensis]